MIDIREIFAGGSRVLQVFNYSPLTYTLSASEGVVVGSVVTVPDTVSSVTLTFDYEDLTSEDLEYTLRLKTKTHLFSLPYQTPKYKEHIFLNGLIRKYFQGWSTAGTTDFSAVSRFISPLVLGLLNTEVSTLVTNLTERNLSIFPLSNSSITTATSPGHLSIESPGLALLSHLHDFSEVAPIKNILSSGYLYGGEIAVGNERRRESCEAREEYLFSTVLKFGKNNQIRKHGTGFINSKIVNNMVVKNRAPCNIVYEGHTITLYQENEKVISFYSPVEVTGVLMTIFGDVFILGSDKKLYYAKTEVYIPSTEELNPSWNNNNIVEMSGDYFCPGDTVEIIVDMEYLRNIDANTVIIKISNQTESIYLTNNDEYSSTQTRIPVSNVKNIKLTMDTEVTDRSIKTEVFVDHNPVPYVAYSSATLLELTPVTSNRYAGLYACDDRVTCQKIVIDTPLVTEEVVITATYRGCIENGDGYVLFKI